MGLFLVLAIVLVLVLLQTVSLPQVGYRLHHGTDTANLQLVNTLKIAWVDCTPLYGCSWDVTERCLTLSPSQ